MGEHSEPVRIRLPIEVYSFSGFGDFRGYTIPLRSGYFRFFFGLRPLFRPHSIWADKTSGL